MPDYFIDALRERMAEREANRHVDPRPPRVRNAEETVLDLHHEIERLLAVLQRIKELPPNSSLDLAQSIAADALDGLELRAPLAPLLGGGKLKAVFKAD